jgi:hypothetical protein
MRNALLVVLLSGAALAQPKVCVAEFHGPTPDDAHKQIETAICPLVDCVPQSALETGGQPDGKKAKKLGVQFFVDGTVHRKGGKADLTLFVFDKYPGNPKWKKAWPLSGNELGPEELAQARAALIKQMGLDAAASAPAEK